MKKKRTNLVIGLSVLIIAILLLGVDRLFISADNASYGQSMTIVTVVALILFLIGAIWVFYTTFE